MPYATEKSEGLYMCNATNKAGWRATQTFLDVSGMYMYEILRLVINVAFILLYLAIVIFLLGKSTMSVV